MEESMRIRDIFVIFMSLFIALGGLALPIWWDPAEPYISQFPVQLAELTRNIDYFINLVMEIIMDRLNQFL